MTKKDIVKNISEQIGLPRLRTKDLVQLTFDALIETLVKDGRVELRNFGVFQIKRREPRMARNPRTGEKVPVEARNVVIFKPGKEMEARVRLFNGVSGNGVSGNGATGNGAAVSAGEEANESI